MNLVIPYSVHDQEGRLLVPADTELNPAFMADLCARNSNLYEIIPLLQYGSILKDLMRQFTIPPYDVIFSQDGASLKVLDVLERVRLPLPLLQAMDYFRENDFHTYRHMLIISALSTLILQEIDPKYCKVNEEELAHLGPCHDIGKITVPHEILLKKTPLSRAEHDRLKNHALAGYVLLSYYLKDDQSFTALTARDHHERRNGTGYPAGILQQNLIVEVITVCDIYDALVTQRPYRPVSYDNRSALEELTIMAHHGDIGWKVMEILVAYNRYNKPDPLHIKVSMDRRGKAPANNVYGKIAD
jgi:HD-GYP domain-containing protein (c-di-GMP phosphodiesterase class II)